MKNGKDVLVVPPASIVTTLFCDGANGGTNERPNWTGPTSFPSVREPTMRTGLDREIPNEGMSPVEKPCPCRRTGAPFEAVFGSARKISA
jgi:hypothetical protein